MGDVNQRTYLKHFVPSVVGPILEVGSKDYGSTSSFREFYSGEEYIGIDMESGKNVDLVVDLTKGISGLSEAYFQLAICCSVLEHVNKPWVFAEHLSSVLRPGGILYISVPWVWRYHAYPDDYFRFSQSGIMELFPGFSWSNICYSTNVPGEFIDITPEKPNIDSTLIALIDAQHGKKRQYLPYLMLNMLGQKNQPED